MLTNSDKLTLAKIASNLTALDMAALAQAATDFLPFSTAEHLSRGERGRGFGAGMTTDIGRGTGNLLGMVAPRLLEAAHVPTPTSRNGATALLIASLAAGSLGGQAAGSRLGQRMFHPQMPVSLDHRSLVDRIRNKP